ncbi:NAD-dependent epimerase/dehydratase family protein [Pararhizobium haloflavum]|uniref:NAD-dependent epimerase/dehydratase family protein n=1 Tax=Pararhizobium haloflavum TaxID=2037914 RepID=UPI000C175F32|nr:NAD-dependent epimerase/dehydratase family protein [Pararhizobium haloflavum]
MSGSSAHRVLVTGASGFVGRAVIARIAEVEHLQAVAAVRKPVPTFPVDTDQRLAPHLGPTADWTTALHGIDLVVHCAARVHRLGETAAEAEEAHRQVNRDGTLAIALQAARAGVSRFLFISTIKVNGERTEKDAAFGPDDAPRPLDPYAVSKWEAEQGLREIAARTGMQAVVVRPPLVYGAGVRGNLDAMMGWIARGIPLPLGAIDNRRSLVSRDNLADLALAAITCRQVPDKVLMAGDGHDVSTPELLRRVAAAMDRPARLVPVPAPLLRAAAMMTGRRAAAARLLDSLRVDISQTCSELDWRPPHSTDAGIAAMANDFFERKR